MAEIRKMAESDKEAVLKMMRVFYASPAVLSNGSEEIFKQDIAHCVEDCPYLEGYVFLEEEKLVGYAMVAKSFSTEFGKPCIWLEDLYIRPAYQGQGIGTSFFAYIMQKYKDCILRLEVERENQRAVHTYEKCGFEEIPYMEMIKK